MRSGCASRSKSDAGSEALEPAESVSWAVDITSGPAGLLLALLAVREQQVGYVPGRTVNTMSAGYRGEAKTDAKDAFVIADVSRVLGDFARVQVPPQLVAELGLLTGHRADLVADRIRLLSRLRELLTGVFPALERAFDYSRHRGALVLLTGYQSPGALRQGGHARLRAWLRRRNVRRADRSAYARPAPPAGPCTPRRPTSPPDGRDCARSLRRPGSPLRAVATRPRPEARLHAWTGARSHQRRGSPPGRPGGRSGRSRMISIKARRNTRRRLGHCRGLPVEELVALDHREASTLSRSAHNRVSLTSLPPQV